MTDAATERDVVGELKFKETPEGDEEFKNKNSISKHLGRNATVDWSGYRQVLQNKTLTPETTHYNAVKGFTLLGHTPIAYRKQCNTLSLL